MLPTELLQTPYIRPIFDDPTLMKYLAIDISNHATIDSLMNTVQSMEDDYLENLNEYDFAPDTITLETGLKQVMNNIVILPYATKSDIDTEFTLNQCTLSDINRASHATLDSEIGQLLQSQGFYPSDLANDGMLSTHRVLSFIKTEIENAYQDEPNVIAIPIQVSLYELFELINADKSYTIKAPVGIYNPINGSSSIFEIYPTEPIKIEKTAPIMIEYSSIGYSLSEIVGDDIYNASPEINMNPIDDNHLKGIQLTLF